MNFDPFTTFNNNLINEDTAFKLTLKFLIVILDLIHPGLRSCLNNHIVSLNKEKTKYCYTQYHTQNVRCVLPFIAAMLFCLIRGLNVKYICIVYSCCS